MAYFTDMQHLALCQSQNILVGDLVVFSFRNKLKLFVRDFKSNNVNHFSCLQET